MMRIVAEFRKPDQGTEGRFYEELAPQLPCRTPVLLRREPGALVFERLPPQRPLGQWTAADLLSGARMLALVHGRFWGLSALVEERPWLPRRGAGEPVALVHGDFLPGHLYMAEDGTKWVLSWRRVALGDPATDLAIYAEAAIALRPKLGFTGILDAYLDVLCDRMEVVADPGHYLECWRRKP